MHRIRRRSIPPCLRAIESASRRPTLCFAVRDDENKTGGMIVREKNLPAEVGKPQTPPRSASEVIAEMAAKVARYPAKPKEEWEEMSAEEMYQRGAERNKKAESAKWYRRAAERGHADAQYILGLMYFEGDMGVPWDDAEAVKWCRRAAEQGHSEAQGILGDIYARGKLVPLDTVEAVKWYRRAAEQGDAEAQYSLGWMYHLGQGVPLDKVEAVKWIRRAAEQGYGEAQEVLGERYSKGEGVPKNKAEADKWFRLAAEQGFEHHADIQRGKKVE